MVALTRVTQKIFASDPQGVEQLAQIGSLAAGAPAFTNDDAELMQDLPNFLEGWFSLVLGENSPAIEDRNSLDYLITRQLAYIFEKGVPEWIATTNYFIGSIVQVAGDTYVSLTNDNLNHPVTNETYWRDAGKYFNARLVNGRIVPLNPVGGTAWPKFVELLLGSGTSITDIKISPNSQFLSYTDSTTGTGLKILNFQNGRVNAVGAASISAQPAGASLSHSYSPDGRTLVVVSSLTPFITIYDINGTTFTKQTNPSVLPTTPAPYQVVWHPSGDLFAFLGDNLNLYQRSGTVFEKRANPSGTPVGAGAGLAFSPDGNYFATTIGDAAGFQVWSIDYTGNNAFYSFTKLVDPAHVPSVDTTEITWSYDSKILVVGTLGGATADENVIFYKIVAGVLTHIPQAQTFIGYVSSLHFTPDDKFLMVAISDGLGGTNGVQSYSRDIETFSFAGLRLGAVLATTSNKLAISEGNKFVCVTQTNTGNQNLLVYKNPNQVDVVGRTARILNKGSIVPLW